MEFIKKNSKIILPLGILLVTIIIILIIVKVSTPSPTVDTSTTQPENIVTAEAQALYDAAKNKNVKYLTVDDAKSKALIELSDYQLELDSQLESLKNNDNSDVTATNSTDNNPPADAITETNVDAENNPVDTNAGENSDKTEAITLPTSITFDLEVVYSELHKNSEICGNENNEIKCIYDPEDNYYVFKVVDIYKYEENDDIIVDSQKYINTDIIVDKISGNVEVLNRKDTDLHTLNVDGDYSKNGIIATIKIKVGNEGLIFDYEQTGSEGTKSLTGLATKDVLDNTFIFNLGTDSVKFTFNLPELEITGENLSNTTSMLAGTYQKKLLVD